MSQRPILTQNEVQEYVTHVLMAFRHELEREMIASGEPLELGDEFELHAVLYDLTGRFDLDPGQRAMVCGVQACLVYDPPDTPLIVAGHNGSTPQTRREPIKAGVWKSNSGHGNP